MPDLACHSWCRPLSVVTAALVWPFVWLDRHGRDQTTTVTCGIYFLSRVITS